MLINKYKTLQKDYTIIENLKSERYRYHLLDASPWPLLTGLGALILTSGLVNFFHNLTPDKIIPLAFLILILSVGGWWRDVIREATFEGKHTKNVQELHQWGMILFIVSEIMFFAGFFWAFISAGLSPTFSIGGVWPPAFLSILSPWGVPFLNTLILLSSGVTITVSHFAILEGNYKQMLDFLALTLGLGFIFLILQLFEYTSAPFNISDGIYGSCFYMATGFHGFHVFVGAAFLTVCFFRACQHHFTQEHHVGFEAAAWYWHFVDVVWLFLFILVYYWGT